MQNSRSWSAVFGIEPGEGKRVFLFVTFSFFLGVANNFSQTAAYTLFLSHYTAQTLSYIYLLNAVIVTALTALYLRLGSKLAFQRLLKANFFFLLALTGIFWVSLLLNAGWQIFLLPVVFQVIVNFGILAFWPLVNRLFTVRQGKRLFGLVGSGQWVGIVATGFLMGPLSAAIGTQNLLGLALFGLAGALGMMWAITHTYREEVSKAGGQPAAADGGKGERRPSVWREPYIVLIFGLIIAWWVGFFLMDNLFLDRASAQYANQAQLAGFLGNFFSVLGILTLLMNFVLTGRIVSRYGVRTSLLILPSVLAGAALLMAVGGSFGVEALTVFWMTIAAKLFNATAGFSVDRSAQSLLYQPFPVDRRAQVQTMAEGAMQPVGNGLAGLIILALGAAFKVITLPLIFALLGVSLAWVAIAYALGKEYPRKLLEAISRRRLDLSAINLADASTIAVLRKVLSDPHPGPAIYAATCLQDANRLAFIQAIPELMRHPSPEVRRDIYERVERLKLEETLPGLRKALEAETDPEARYAGIRALFSFGKAEDLERSGYYLSHPISQVRLGAIAGMIRAGGMEGPHPAREWLLELTHAEQAGERILACQAIGEAGSPEFIQPLATLLQDPEVEVRQAALRAAGKAKSPTLWPLVIAALADPGVRAAATRSLAAGGDTALPLIRATLEQKETSPVVRRQLLAACLQAGSAEGLALLRSQLDAPDLETRGQALNSLNRAGYQIHPEESARWFGRIREEARFSAWLIASGMDLSACEACYIVSAALQGELANSRERILDLLACLGDRQNLRQVRQALDDPSPDRRSYALEIIDTQLPQELKPALIPLLDTSMPEKRLQRLAGHFPQRRMSAEQRLEEIANRPLDWNTAWLAATAFYAARKLHSAWQNQVDGRIKEIEDALTRDMQAPDFSRAGASSTRTAGAVPEGETMYSLIERVLILKKSSLFSETPDDALAEVAQTLKEASYPAGQLIIEKNAPGNSMYMIASGKVRVFDGGRTINYLEEGDVFGEMAVLDPAPRSASVEAVVDSDLLQIDQVQLFELIESRLEVARGIIQVLSRHLRNRMRDLDRLENVQEQPGRK
jgi:AAA family ATP:ADP antiporter